MLFAHLKRILRLGRLRLRGPNGAKDEFLLAATAQNLRKLREARPPSRSRSSSREADRPSFTSLIDAAHPYRARPKTGFFNEIDVNRTYPIGTVDPDRLATARHREHHYVAASAAVLAPSAAREMSARAQTLTS